MASPITTPTPPPTPRPPHRSIAGPVVLILMGVLFLLGTMRVLDMHTLGMLFARYWPALLILWGVIKLIEYEEAKRSGQPARGIGVGGVFLMLFLIFAGLIATQVSRWNWRGMGIHLGDDEDLNEFFGGSTFDYSDELTQEIPAGAILHVSDDRGAITVNVADGKTMKVSVRKKVRAEKEQDAENYNRETKPQVTVTDKVITLNANTQGAGDKGVTTDMEIYVPANTPLEITSGHGDVTIAGMSANVEVKQRRGEINVNNQTGNVLLDLSGGFLEGSSVRVAQVKGDVTIQGEAHRVAVEDVDGAVHLTGEFYETTRLARVSKTVSFHSSRTDMEFSRLDGRLDLDSDDLRADSLLGPMRLTTRSKDISLEGFSDDLRLEDSNGTVSLGLQKPGNIQIDNRKGDVQVTIPLNTAIKIEARTHEGEIESDFNEIKVDNQDHQSSASGSIGTNGKKLVINCDKGAIEIRKGTVAAPAPAVAPAPPATPAKPGKPAKELPAPKAKPVETDN